jgi:hypothetical protein
VLNVEYGSIGASPSIQQLCDICFRVGVVSSTPTRIIEAFLYINDDEGSIRTQWTGGIRDHYRTSRDPGDLGVFQNIDSLPIRTKLSRVGQVVRAG